MIVTNRNLPGKDILKCSLVMKPSNVFFSPIVKIQTIDMKHISCLLAIICITLFSCRKEGEISILGKDNGRIERKIVPVSAHSISGADVASVNNLFLTNGILNTKYRYSQYLHDTVQALFPPYTIFDHKTVRADEYTNGLRIFTGQVVFGFKNDILNFSSGNLTKGSFLNTTSQLTLNELRKFFINDIEQFDHQGNQYQDSCLNAEFGYFNLNRGAGNEQEILVKAWRITTKNSVYPSEYPQAFYNDNDGQLLRYDNGLKSFK